MGSIMKYLPTLNLWDRGIHTALVSGQLKLQSGQWIKCGDDSQKSRFLEVKNGVINACHGGSNKQVIDKYIQRSNYARLSKIKNIPNWRLECDKLDQRFSKTPPITF
jgi:hypothetical protein